MFLPIFDGYQWLYIIYLGLMMPQNGWRNPVKLQRTSRAANDYITPHRQKYSGHAVLYSAAQVGWAAFLSVCMIWRWWYQGDTCSKLYTTQLHNITQSCSSITSDCRYRHKGPVMATKKGQWLHDIIRLPPASHGESISHRLFPSQRASNSELWWFFFIVSLTKLLNE